MKKDVIVEQHTCDICKRGRWCSPCDRCGKDVCLDCIEAGNAVRYTAGVHFSSNDARYCKECDEILMRSGGDRVWNAYRAIHDLKQEEKQFWERFELRMKAAEKVVETIGR